MTIESRHRPVELDEIVGQPTDEIKHRLRGRDTPNFLLYGPPGTGKTTAARCIAREMHGSTDALLELNAADTNVEDVRTRIKRAGRQLTLSGAPPVVVLDEMETMGYTAQQALKKRMEEYPSVFVLITNDTTLDKINDALIDRCKEVEFDALPNAVVENRLLEVAEKEGIDLDPDRAEVIASFANGSLRKALSKLADERPRWSTTSSDGAGDDWEREDVATDDDESAFESIRRSLNR